jgi:hypothetical protein
MSLYYREREGLHYECHHCKRLYKTEVEAQKCFRGIRFSKSFWIFSIRYYTERWPVSGEQKLVRLSTGSNLGYSCELRIHRHLKYSLYLGVYIPKRWFYWTKFKKIWVGQ